jgi:hypothetical protein
MRGVYITPRARALARHAGRAEVGPRGGGAARGRGGRRRWRPRADLRAAAGRCGADGGLQPDAGSLPAGADRHPKTPAASRHTRHKNSRSTQRPLYLAPLAKYSPAAPQGHPPGRFTRPDHFAKTPSPRGKIVGWQDATRGSGLPTLLCFLSLFAANLSVRPHPALPDPLPAQRGR